MKHSVRKAEPSLIILAAGMHRKSNSWNWTRLFFHWRKKVPFKYVWKKQITNTPDKRHSQPTFIAWECFYGQLTNSSKQVLRSNENIVGTFAGALAKGLSTWSLQWAQPKCSSPSSLQTGQHCLQMVQGCSTQSWVTSSSWQSNDDKLPDSKAGTANTTEHQNTERAKQGSPDAITNPQSCSSHGKI